MHIAKLIRRRFPHNSNSAIAILVLVSGSAILVGIGLLLMCWLSPSEAFQAGQMPDQQNKIPYRS